MMRVTPHPKLVENITARRGEHDFAPALPALDVAAVWKAAQTSRADRNYDRNKNDPHVKRAMAMIKAGALPEPFDSTTVAVAERLLCPPNTLVRVIAEARGIPEMVAIKLDSTRIGMPNEGKLTFDGHDPFIRDHGDDWAVARSVVCHADEASYEGAKQLAEAWRRKYPVKARTVSSFLFPSETAWAHADFDELLTLSKTDAWGYFHMFPLLSVVQDEARVMAMIDQIILAGQKYQLQNMMGRAACEVAVSLRPEAALRVFEALLNKGARGAGKTEVAMLGHAMAALEGEEAAVVLAGLLLHPAIGPIAADYFRRFPELAKVALPKVASGTSKAADAARSILAAQKQDDSPVAEPAEVPTLLRETPWRKRKKSKVVALAVTAPLPKTTIKWKNDDEKREAAKGTGYYATHQPPDMPASELAKWSKLDPRFRPVDLWMRWDRQRVEYRVPADVGLREWNENASATTQLGPLRMLAVHGDAALPGLFARDPFSHHDWQWGASGDGLLDAYFHAVGPETARVAATALVRRKAWRKLAQEWIAAHAAVVAQSLVPLALGKDSRERKEAENAIRWTARAHKQQVIDAATALGPDAERAVIEMVERDPLTDLEVRGKLPPFIRVADLPSLRTRGGKRLPEDAALALLEILRSTSPDLPYAGLEPICEELDEGSLGDFAWALVQAWILAGAKGTFEWVPLTLALIGNDSCARRLAPYVRDWARKDAKKAKMCVDVLSAMGSATALLHLAYVADKSRFDEAKTYAKETLERVAAHQGLTTDELADRTVPDLELDKDGTATLDFGPRKFTVTFDEGLTPVLTGEDGTRLPAFPRGTKTDDAAMVKAASARFKALKADAEAVAQTLLRRFERAMIRGRTWRADAFRTYVIEHPLVTHIARRLVWQGPNGPFRVTGDGTLADASDAEMTLSGDAVVSLPHPLTLGKEAVTTWSRIASDYAVVQPFEQLGRATYNLEPSEAQTSKLSRYEGKKSKPGPLLGSLEARGWQKWPDETSLSSCGKKVRTRSGAEAQVSLGFSPGIDLGDVANAPEQTLHAPSLSGVASWAAVDDVDLSELLRDMEFLAH